MKDETVLIAAKVNRTIESSGISLVLVVDGGRGDGEAYYSYG